MQNLSSVNRRNFISLTSSAALAGLAVRSLPAASPRASAAKERSPVVVFAKHAQHLSFDELGKRLNAIGVQGIEATLRRQGQIEPADLPERLGGLCDALAKHDQRVWIAASDVNEVNSETESYIEALAKHGVPYFRMAYYKYQLNQPILPQLDKFAKQAQELAAFCESKGVTALYQNHAGKTNVGAGVWDLLTLLQDINPKSMAVAFDVRHATLELGQSNAVAHLAIQPHIGATYVKDFDWADGKAKNVPLGTGLAQPLFNHVQSQGFPGPISLHMEYIDHKGAELQEERWQAIANDVRTLQGWLNK